MRQRDPSAVPPPPLPAVRPASLTPRSPSDLVVPTRPPRPAGRSRPIREPRRLNGFFRFVNGVLTFAFLLLSLVGIIALSMRAKFDTAGPLATSAVAIIAKGEGITEIAARLERDGIVADRRVFAAQYYAQRLYGGLSGDKTDTNAPAPGTAPATNKPGRLNLFDLIPKK